MIEEARVTGKRQITIPKNIYTFMGLKNTDKLIFEVNINNEVVIRKKEIDTLNICPICEREVNNEGTMVVKDSQKYHLACWESAQDSSLKNIPAKCEAGIIYNDITDEQMRVMRKVSYMASAYKVDISRKLNDNEAIIMAPVKVTFMENKPNVIGAVGKLKSSEIFKCSINTDDSDDECEIEYSYDDVVANKLTKTQKKSISRILAMLESYKKDMSKGLGGNEVIIMVPTKIVFMENKPGAIGMIGEYNSNNIFACNSEATFVSRSVDEL